MPPSRDELEISVIGPGYGESLVIHVGEGEWLIVDSCRDRGDRKPRPLAYLDQIGVPRHAVKGILVTHWDTDHVRGIDQIVDECSSADFYISAALLSDEFEAMIELYDRAGPHSPVTAFSKALAIIKARGRDPIQLSEHKRVMIGSNAVEVFARSPSSATLIDAHVEIARFLNGQAGFGLRPIDFERNHRSVAISIRLGSVAALLGSDLENQNGLRGWAAVVDSANRYPRGQVYKVAHHGSADADNDEIWKRLLSDQATAVVAPWTSGAYPRPSREDLERLLIRTPNVFVTGIPQYVKSQPLSTATNLGLWGIQMFKEPNMKGVVRLRGDGGTGKWGVELSDTARRVTPTLAKAFRADGQNSRLPRGP